MYQPSKQEWDDHMRARVPFRRWCPYCVRGKCKSAIHKKNARASDEGEPEVPKYSWDYMGKKTKGGKDRRIDSLPILVGIDDRPGYISVHMVPKKGSCPHAIKMVSREIDLAGYNRLILKSDQENSILDLLKAAKRERGEFVEIMPEESPVGDHQSNGAVERAIQTIEAQIRMNRAG